MKRILVPTDFSKYAENALKIAFQIARKAAAEVIVVHIIPSLQSVLLAADTAQSQNNLESEYISFVKERAKNELDKITAQEEFPERKVRTKVEIGNIHQTIIQDAKEMEIDLIVMGTQGVSALEEIFIGSNTEKIVRNAPCPVLAVKNAPANFILSNILFPTDFQESHVPAIAKLKEIQSLFDGHIHLLHINTVFNFLSSTEIEERKNKFIRNCKLSNYTLHALSARTEEAGIINAAQMLEVDMIALATNQRQGLSHLFMGSIAENLVNHAEKPVLTIGIKS